MSITGATDLRRRSILILICFLPILVLISIEILVRESGIVDMPIYLVDSEIGYIPKPNQSGAFLNKNVWVFNNRSMAVGQAWDPKGHVNVLLIGNSVVMGGDPYNQRDKLGPLIQREVGQRFAIWPIAAGGWTNVNETIYLNANPDVAEAANFFVWEYMAGGLSKATPWPGEYVWPRQHPSWATWYCFRHFVVPYIISVHETALPPIGAVNTTNLDEFKSAVSRLSMATGRRPAGILLLYPTESNLNVERKGGEWLAERGDLEKIAAQFDLQIVDVARSPLWNKSLYRADHIHPTVAGNVVLADIVTQAIQDTYSNAVAAQ
jgi:hypothetical protein